MNQGSAYGRQIPVDEDDQLRRSVHLRVNLFVERTFPNRSESELAVGRASEDLSQHLKLLISYLQAADCSYLLIIFLAVSCNGSGTSGLFPRPAL